MASFSPGWNFIPPTRLKFCCDYMASFCQGWNFEIAVVSGRPPSCFAENTIPEHAQAHFSARAESLMRVHEVFLNFSPGWKSQPSFTNRAGNLSPGWNSARAEIQPGLKFSPCNRKRLFKKICSGGRGEPGWNSPCNRPLRNITVY